MRHAFPFVLSAREALKKHVKLAVADVDPQSFFHEPTYVTALAKKLEGVVYNDTDGFIAIKSTIVDSIGRGAAEKWSGADFAITATISNKTQKIRKAILIQSKMGSIKKMSPSKKNKLDNQIVKMKSLTRSPKVMEIIEDGKTRRINIISGNKILKKIPYREYDLGDYFVRRILTTLDGDTHTHFVDGVQDHDLCKLEIIAETSLSSRLKKNNR